MNGGYDVTKKGAGIRPLFAVDIVCPLFYDLLGRPAATVVPLPGGGPVLLGLIFGIDISLFL
jgi:hypothetical protein